MDNFMADYKKSVKIHQEWIDNQPPGGDWKKYLIMVDELEHKTEFAEPMPWQKILEKHKTF